MKIDLTNKNLKTEDKKEYQSNSENLKIQNTKYFSIIFYRNMVDQWNKMGRIKSSIILISSLFPLFLFNLDNGAELINSSVLGISVIFFISIILFLTLVTKFWSLFGIEFKKPNWNESPISLNFSKSLNFFQFIGYWFITSGITKIIFIGVFYQILERESVLLFFYGISLLVGIKLSLKWLNKSKNRK